MKVMKACPTWQPENMFEKLNCVSFILPCEVFLVITVLLSHTELKNLMNIIATEEVVFYVENVSEKNHIYEKFWKSKHGDQSAMRSLLSDIKTLTIL